MNTKNNKRYKVNNEKIETAFLSLLYNHRYEDITIGEICKTADINRSTFYAHYDDINDLIIKIESNFAHSMSIIFDYGLRQNNEAFIEMFTFVKKNKFFYKAFLSIPYTTVAEINTKKEIVNKLKETASIEKHFTDIELYYRANFFGAGIKEICRIWLERDCQESPEFMADMIYREYANRKSMT